MDALTSHSFKLYLAGRRHGGAAGHALRCRDGVLLRPEFRFASRPLKVADSGFLRLSSSKLRRPICFAASGSNAEVSLSPSTFGGSCLLINRWINASLKKFNR